MRIVFMGTPNAAVPSLQRCLNDGHEVVAVYTQPDRPSGRGNRITFSPVKEFALANHLPVFQPVKIKTPEMAEQFRQHHADLTVVVAYGRILPESYLTAFPMGAVNVHFSLLPKYRGAAPVNWAVVNGETETGVTTMRMDAGLDTGDILLQRKTSIGEEETAVELMARLSSSGADLLSETLSRLATIQPQPQDHAKASFAPIMKREDGVIDWQMTARDISNRIRGFQPFPSAFTIFRGQKITIWKGFPAGVFNEAGCGQILAAHGDDLIVGAADGSALRIDEVQPEGKRRMLVRDFVNGFRPQVGEVFGV